MGIILPHKTNKNRKTVHYGLVDSKNLLLIFTRNPELGKCKTRLAATVGDETALKIYKFLLAHTVKITSNLTVAKQVHYSERVRENDIWDNVIYDKRQQVGNDLGERMANAFQEGFASGFEKICIIGSDMFDLDQTNLEQAFLALDSSDFVIGPAIDGGYYLLGMKVFEPRIFKNKDWGTDSVFQDTLTDLKDYNLHLLDKRNDVDVYEDIKDIPAFKPFLKNI
ncbi:TIGR04282 family arsenosugar biosynthesis glycosyltransferase [Maribacter halichondriae]|uniref:TIGR04282 family arsenosugar biosynthesis glycosyltransferase n=1 Tax=Maribacter halichondriae TaxID=2980554 RepID=UPI0023587D6B|nr:TIGR04282 family arsenosugar biosynthesis glycosyltransferase [Maribacter sp. Hal144]